MNAIDASPVNPVTPVTLLTGFLGSGKTTLLNRLLNTHGVPETAVLINEFGEVSIDHLLVRESSDNIQVMQNGCVCCSVAGDMVRALRDLYFKRSKGEIPKFSRVVIETTGLADPAPIMHTLLEMPVVAARYVLSGVVTTVDATHGEAQLDRHPEVVKQIAVADRIMLTKTDLADAATLDRLRARMAAINPGALVVETIDGNISLSAFFDTGLYQPARKTPDVANWLRAEAYRPVVTAGSVAASRHADGISSMSVRYDEPLDWDKLVDVIEMLQAMRGDHLLRIKGIVNVAGTAAPRILHAVQHTLYPPATLKAWPDHDHSTRLVFIVKDLDLQFVRASLDEFLQRKSSAALPDLAPH
jgi:G3E family GTPase